MTSTLNPHFLSEMLALPVRNLQDGTDYPHSGMFDMLHKGLKGDYAVKMTATDFDITQSSTGSVTRLAVKGGAVMRNNALTVIGGGSGSSTNLDLTTTAGKVTTNGTTLTASRDVTPIDNGDCYLMIVAAADNTIQLRGESGTAFINKVPMILTNDIPIAMVKVAEGAASTDTATDRPIQYFTTDKTAESLSLFYSSGTYPAHVANLAGQISSTATGNSWNTNAQNITFLNSLGTPGQIDLILLTAPDDNNAGPKLSLKNQKAGGSSAGNTIAGTIQFESIDDGDAAAPTASIVSKIKGIAAGNEFGDLRFSVANQNGGLVETLSLVGSAVAADTRVGINKAVPLSTLDISGSLGVALVHDTSTSKDLDIFSSYVVLDNSNPTAANLPAATVGRVYHLKNDGGGQVTVNRAGSDTITMQNGSTPPAFTLDQGHWATLVGAAGTWHLMQKGSIA